MANDNPKEQKDSPATTTAAPANDAVAGPDLTVQDLATLRSVIDVASSRGAFKAGELESVGKIYNKLDQFLNALSAQQKGTA